MLTRVAMLLTVILLLAGCDAGPPALRLVPDPLAPAPPPDAAFASLPGDAEVPKTLRTRFSSASSIELIGKPNGEVLWLKEGDRSYWVYPRRSRVLIRSVASPLANVEQKVSDGVRFEFWNGRWQPGGMWHGVSSYRGIEDPTPEQVVALLQMPGINYHEHRLGSVPQRIEFDALPAFERDEDGFAPPRLEVEFRARATEIEFGADLLHNVDVRMRATIQVDVREGRWSAWSQVELLEIHRRSAEHMESQELLRRHWEMDRFWRRH